MPEQNYGEIQNNRIPLVTSVTLTNGVPAVVSGQSTCDYQRYRVSFFNRHFWRVEHRWVSRSQFEVVPQKQTTAEAVAA